MWSNILDRISYWSLFLVIVLLPFFFFPFLNIPIEIGKGFLVAVGLVVSVVAYMGARFADGKIILAKAHVFLGGLAIVVATFLSAFFSSSVKTSLFGVMFDTGTAFFILAAFLLMVMSSIFFKDHNKAKQVIFGSMFSFAIVFLFQILRISAPEFFSFGALESKTDNLFGSWNSLGIMASLSLLGSVLILEFFNLKKQGKIIALIIGIFSLFFVMAVNFPLSWQIIGVFALFLFVYKVSISNKREQEAHKFSFPSYAFGLVMIALLFFMSGQFIGSYLPSVLKINSIEVGPSLDTTFSVAKNSLAKDPVFGIGPNKFSEIWALYKPQSINATQFWDTAFSVGSGLLPTMAISTGIFGILSWLGFLVLFIFFVFKVLFIQNKENIKWEVPFFVFSSTMLFAFSLFYSVSNSIFFLAFAYMGIAIGIIYSQKEKGEIHFAFLGDPRRSFFAILALILIMIISAGAGFKYIEKFASVSYFRNALSAQEINKAENSINKAVSLYPNDLYLRTFSQVYLIKLNSITSKSDITDEDKSVILDSFNKAQLASRSAVEYDPSNYINHRSLATVYSTVAPLGVEGATDEAIKALDKAIALNPLNPGLELNKSQVYLSANKTKEAKISAQKALELKNDYVDALIFLSQIAKREGDRDSALNYAEQALRILPNNKDLIDYVASFKSFKLAPPEETEDDKKNN